MVYERIGLYGKLLRKTVHQQLVEHHVTLKLDVAHLHHRTLCGKLHGLLLCLTPHERDLKKILSGTLGLDVEASLLIGCDTGNGNGIIHEQAHSSRRQHLGNLLGIHYPALHGKTLRNGSRQERY